ncbi:hypothetical protein AALB47_12135 [Lachnospiraceae bacterium 54-11]
MSYRTRQDISTHQELLKEIITFKETFCFIFRNAGNPKIEIMVYDPDKNESHLFEINTKYQRDTTEIIERKYNELYCNINFFRNFENIAGVDFSAKGTVRGKQTIYNNPDSPWSYHSLLMEKKYHNII